MSLLKLSFAALGGVVLPAAALGVEFTTGMAAEFFDPIPSIGHILAIVAVGLANALAIVRLCGRYPSWLRDEWLVPLLAVAGGIAAVYALGFIPITPFALVGILALGLGLLPLSPLSALVVTGVLGNHLVAGHRVAGTPGFRRALWFAAGLAIMLALETPGLVHAWALRAINSPDRTTQGQAVAALRRLGDARLLRECYFSGADKTRRSVYQFLFGAVPTNGAGIAYYRVTGRPYQSQSQPSRSRYWPDRWDNRSNGSWDWAQGGTEIGELQPGLSLTQSRLEGYANGDAAVGYLEWTMIFRNESEFQQREARALVQLPPGAVVSRLTLWVDGEEREAAFGGGSEVRQAYQAVVSRRRDPVLVTMKGPDRVLMQCFPVQPRGEMKIRLGISLPLVIDTPADAQLAFPRLIARNFAEDPALVEAVWLESDRPLRLSLPGTENVAPGKLAYAVRAKLSREKSPLQTTVATVERDPAAVLAWTADLRDSRNAIRQRLTLLPAINGPLTIVIDGSHDLAAAADALAEILANAGADTKVRLLVAGDAVKEFPEGPAKAAAGWLRQQDFVGGQDAGEALERAITGQTSANGSILWIHGAQPLAWTDSGSLEQALARQRGLVRWFVLPATPGANVLLEKIGVAVRPVVGVRLGSLAEDIERVLGQIRQGRMAVVRDVVQSGDVPAGLAATSSHLARLWAAGEVERLAARGPAGRPEALGLAKRMQLVTSVSGAVVLETKQQYDAAGLTPVNPNSVPSVPDEGNTLLLLATSFGMMLFVRSRSWRCCGHTLPTTGTCS